MSKETSVKEHIVTFIETMVFPLYVLLRGHYWVTRASVFILIKQTKTFLKE